MNLRKMIVFRAAAASLLCVAFSSCGDDPELVNKREQQRAEIGKLEAQLSVLEERMESVPPDRSQEIADLKEESKANLGEIAALEGEIQKLEQEKAEIEKDYEAYRRKYVAN